MAIETIKITNSWVELPVMTGDVITIFSLCSQNQYAEIYIGSAVSESSKGIPVKAFRNIKFKKPSGKIFAKNPYGESSVVITDTLISGLADGGSGADVALIKEEVDLMRPMFTDLWLIQNFVSGLEKREGNLYKNEKGVWYCDLGNADTEIDPASPNWIDFSIMNGYDLLQKRAKYIFKMDKITPTDSFFTVDNFLPIDGFHQALGSHVLDNMVFYIMYTGENVDVGAGSPMYIQFIDKSGSKIGTNPLLLKHVEGNMGGYVNFEGKMLTGTIITIVKPAGKEYFVKI